MKAIPIQDNVTAQSDLWCQLCPYGEFPGTVELPDGKKRRVTQRCDAAAFEQLVRNFAPEVLMDAEHRSEDADDTCAMAWVQELRVDPDTGLMARIRPTDVGAAELNNRRRRFPSPAWTLDGDDRPLKLVSVGLTNKPNIAMRPVLNKESPATGGGEQQGSPEMDLKELAKALGLSETATAEEVMAALKAVIDEKGKLEVRVAELEKSALKAEANGVVAANKDRIGDADKFVELYCANKAFALKALEAMVKPAKETVTNKGEAQRPAGAGGVAKNKLEEYRGMPAGKAKDDFLAANAAELLRLDNAAKA
jgi:phage I-like protein